MRLQSPFVFFLLLLLLLGLQPPKQMLILARSIQTSPSSSSSSKSSSQHHRQAESGACRSAGNVRLRYQKATVVLDARLTVPRVKDPPSQAHMHVVRVLKGETRSITRDEDVLVVGFPPGLCSKLQTGRRYFVFGEVAGNATVRAEGFPLRAKNAKNGVKKGQQCKKCAGVKLNGTASVGFNLQINLTCRVTGKPTPKVTWYKDGQKVNTSVAHIKAWNKKNISLRINQARREDAGEYECRAESATSAASKTFYVTVTKSPYEGQPCRIQGFCLNGGTCTYLSVVNTSGEHVCQCAEGYEGQRCEAKHPSQSNVRAESLGIDVSTRTLSLYWGK